MDVSFLIPARNEAYLEQTIRNILTNIRGDSEILVALDGYLPDPRIETNSDRVKFYHNPESIGQRQSINLLAREARGKYVCKIDAHCAIDEGFDIKMMADCPYEWTVIPRMYNLDIETFMPKLRKRTDYMYIGWRDDKDLRAEYYTGKEYKQRHRNPLLIDDTMCCMGPCFFMHRDRFWELGGCDEGHGGWGQQGIEVACKAWLSGGALKVNKKTWFAHWFRGGSGPGFPYHLSGRAVDAARAYSKKLWMQNQWEKQTRTFQWLLSKFDPPGWKNIPELSVIIPSYKDPFLHKTIADILEKFTGSFEIIPVIDGYKLKEPLPEDPRIKPVILKTNGGMRNAINAGVQAARGKWLMRSDEHCMFAPGFDREMLRRIHRNWIVTARRYFLDPYKWEIMEEEGFIDYEKLIIKGGYKFSAMKWWGRTKSHRNVMLDKTMAMQGSCWIMSRKWWDEVIGELQTEGYGPHYQDTTEMSFKTWAAGGKLMLNKNTWYAHKHRSFNRSHQYPEAKAMPEWKYALDKWQPEYEQIRKTWNI